MTEQACVYSVLVGGYEELLEQPVARSSDVDFILFTDDCDLKSDTWQIRTEDPILPPDPARSSRYAKILPHRVLPEYDVSIYVDNCLLLREPPETILDELLPDDAAFALNAHDYRDTVRAEFEAVIELEKDAPWVCAEQLEHYERWHRDVLDEKPLWTGFMIRRHHNPVLVRTMELWWTQLLRYSKRDQLSIMMALRETGLEPTVLANPLRSSKYHEWPQDVGRVEAGGGKPATMTELDACREELDRVNEEWAIAIRRSAELQAEIDTFKRDVGGLGEEIAEREQLQAEHDQLAERLQLMHDSTSWTITAPLRRIGDRLGRGS